jgi:hypothetical protein
VQTGAVAAKKTMHPSPEERAKCACVLGRGFSVRVSGRVFLCVCCAPNLRLHGARNVHLGQRHEGQHAWGLASASTLRRYLPFVPVPPTKGGSGAIGRRPWVVSSPTVQVFSRSNRSKHCGKYVVPTEKVYRSKGRATRLDEAERVRAVRGALHGPGTVCGPYP